MLIVVAGILINFSQFLKIFVDDIIHFHEVAEAVFTKRKDYQFTKKYASDLKNYLLLKAFGKETNEQFVINTLNDFFLYNEFPDDIHIFHYSPDSILQKSFVILGKALLKNPNYSNEITLIPNPKKYCIDVSTWLVDTNYDSLKSKRIKLYLMNVE
jgi:hypothetical protein